MEKEDPKVLEMRELDKLDRLGYQAQPQEDGEFRGWEEAASWPADVIALLGSGKDAGFPEAEDLRAGHGVDAPREQI